MAFEHTIARAFAMSDEVWARHANPWSAWTRTSTLPLIVLALWSREWIGWWALLPTAAALVWTWLNPRVFAKPRATGSWISKAVLGERVWLNRDQVPVPDHHRRMARLLGLVGGFGMIFVAWGVIDLAIWPALLGLAVVYLGKFWFLDRMVWLYEDMKDADPRYRSWLY